MKGGDVMSLGSELMKIYNRHRLQKEKTVEQDKTFNLNEIHAIVSSLRFIGTFDIPNDPKFVEGFEIVEIRLSRFVNDVDQSEWIKLRKEFEIGFADFVKYQFFRVAECYITEFSDQRIVFQIPVSVYARKCCQEYAVACEQQRIQKIQKKQQREIRLKKAYQNFNARRKR